MELTPNEISDVEDIGILDGTKVKMIRTKGGFHIAVGRPRGKLQEEALAAGSHPAIVKFNLERQHPGYQPNMMKSELLSENVKVEKHSHFLSDTLRKSGHDLYSVQNGPQIEFQITRHNSKVSSVTGILESDALVFKNLDVDKQFARALAGATSEKVLACGAQKIRIEGK